MSDAISFVIIDIFWYFSLILPLTFSAITLSFVINSHQLQTLAFIDTDISWYQLAVSYYASSLVTHITTLRWLFSDTLLFAAAIVFRHADTPFYFCCRYFFRYAAYWCHAITLLFTFIYYWWCRCCCCRLCLLIDLRYCCFIDYCWLRLSLLMPLHYYFIIFMSIRYFSLSLLLFHYFSFFFAYYFH